MTTANLDAISGGSTLVLVPKPRLMRIFSLAVPMIAAALATNLMTLIDTLMVSQLGDAALGGVGLGGQLFFLLLSVALGLAAGVQAMIARRVGENQLAQTGKILNAGLLLALITGLVLLALGYLLLPVITGFINADTPVRAASQAYLATRLPSLVLMSLTLTFRAYWVGVSLAKWSMLSIFVLSLANVLFNYMLIFGNFGAPELGVAGAGLGSSCAIAVGLLLNIVYALKLARRNGFLSGLPSLDHILRIVVLAAPECVRQLLFSLSVVILYFLIGQIGTQELAAFHVVISICLIAYMPHIGIGGAATTLVGEALGRKSVRDASIWGWQISNLGFVVLATLGLVVALFPTAILRPFFNEQSTLVLAVVPLQLAIFAHVFDGYSKILGAALIGAGDTATVMRLTLVTQYLLLLPLLLLSVWLGFGLTEAMAVFLLATIITATLFAVVWQRRRWAAIVV